jgi:outer membrane protein assembly factor BamB
MVSDTGTVYCLDAHTGRSVWEQSFPQQHYASPFAVGDRVYFADTAGKARIVACEPKYRLLATNDLKEPISASFAPVAGRLIVRTAKELWCLEQR